MQKSQLILAARLMLGGNFRVNCRSQSFSAALQRNPLIMSI